MTTYYTPRDHAHAGRKDVREGVWGAGNRKSETPKCHRAPGHHCTVRRARVNYVFFLGKPTIHRATGQSQAGAVLYPSFSSVIFLAGLFVFSAFHVLSASNARDTILCLDLLDTYLGGWLE